MKSTNDTLQALLDYYLNAHRIDGSIDAHAVLLALVRGEVTGKINADVVHSIIQQLGPRENGEFISPKIISQFMADLAKIKQPKSVLDPVCGSGGMLHQIIDAYKPNVAEGIEINGKNCEIATAMLRGIASIIHGDVLYVLPQLEGIYELVVADPPLGVKVNATNLPSSLKALGLRDLAQIIAIEACDRITPEGIVAIVMSEAAFNQHNFITALHGKGCRIRAILHVPPGTRINTLIPSLILVIDHGSQSDVFIAQLSDDPEHSKRVLHNFKRHKSDNHPSLGRTLHLDKFISYEALEAEHLMRLRVRNTHLTPIPFRKFVKEKSVETRDSLEQAASGIPDNSVLLPKSGIRLTLDVSSNSLKDKTYTRFGLDESKVIASYFIRWIESELGLLALRAAGAGSSFGMPHITKKTLERLVCYIPSIEDQKSILEAFRHLERLRNEANEIEAQCWTGSHDSKQILEHAQTINHEDRLEDWLSTLPYPLASILWLHRVSGDDPRIRFGVLLHFFEALAEFLATIHLSAFRSNSGIWQENHGELLKALSVQELTLERATFGTWKVVVEKLGKATRDMLETTDDASVATSLYSLNSKSWLSKLCALEITQVLGRANGIRNTHSGHGGAMGKTHAIALESELLDMIEEVRSVWGRGWNQHELLLIDRMTFTDGQFTYESPRIMGVNNQFERVKRKTTSPMETGQLYLLFEGASKGLKMMPLVRVMSSPSQIANACYFYNRSASNAQRFVSYHFEQESEVWQYFEDTAMILQQLATPPVKITS